MLPPDNVLKSLILETNDKILKTKCKLIYYGMRKNAGLKSLMDKHELVHWKKIEEIYIERLQMKCTAPPRPIEWPKKGIHRSAFESRSVLDYLTQFERSLTDPRCSQNLLTPIIGTRSKPTQIPRIGLCSDNSHAYYHTGAWY